MPACKVGDHVPKEQQGKLTCYRATEKPLTLFSDDYFEFRHEGFDALFDRASMVELDASLRARYASHTRSMMKDDAAHVLITLEYDQDMVDGPPHCVESDEVLSYWPELVRVKEAEAIETCPPKFKEAGVTNVKEVTWIPG